MKIKRILSIITATAMMATMLVGCSSKPADTPAANNGEWQWERNVEIVCPWGNGGGADTTVRTFATALEKELGVSVVVNNKSGAGGVTGVQFATSQPADGYTYLMCTPSPLLAQVTGATDFDVYGKIKPLVQMVHDCNILVAGKDAPYSNYKELMEYVKANPGKVKAGVMSITGLDGACVTAAFNGDIEAVAYTEGAQLNADVIGGHIGLAVCGPAEVDAMVESGDMKVIMSFTEQRLTMEGYENVECAKEIGLDVFYGPARGIFYTAGTPEAAIKAFEAAAAKALASETFQNWAKQEGLDQRQGYKNTADYQTAWDKDYADFVELFGNK